MSFYCVLVVLAFYVIVVLVYLIVLAKRMVKKTPLMTLIGVKEIICTKNSSKSVLCLFGLVYCFVVRWTRPYTIYYIRLWHDIAYLC